MLRFLRKWFITYWRWTWSLIIFPVGFIGYRYFAYRPSPPSPQQTVTAEGGGWFLFSFLLVVGGVVLYRMTRRALPPAWIAVTAICTPLYLWGFWLIAPDGYVEWRQSKYFIWTILAITVLGWLASNRNMMLANTARTGLFLLLIAVVAISSSSYVTRTWLWMNYGPGTWTTSIISRSSLSGVPADVALPIIAMCESGGRQFIDGKLVVNSKNKDGSVDRGKWQINSQHDSRVKELGLDMAKEEDNEKFARILYAENEFADWEATRHCWGPKLMALGHIPRQPRLAVTQPAPRGVTRREPLVASATNLSRHWEKRREGDPKYCWVKTRGPRGPYTDPVQIYPATTPVAESAKIRKLVCVW